MSKQQVAATVFAAIYLWHMFGAPAVLITLVVIVVRSLYMRVRS